MNNVDRPFFRLPVVMTGLAALVAGVWFSMQLARQSAPEVVETQAITVLSAPRQLPDIPLINKDGQTVGADMFKGDWTFLFMGFTNCGHICPTKMAELRMIADAVDNPIRVVFFSVDPTRDTPDVIKAYVEGFDAEFLGLTAAPPDIETLAATLGAPYLVDTTPGNYVVDHSSALFLINPEGAYAGVATPPLEISTIVDDLNKLQR